MIKVNVEVNDFTASFTLMSFTFTTMHWDQG